MAAVKRDLSVLLRDLIEWGEEASAFVAGRQAEWLLSDRTAELALTRLIEVAGEISGTILRRYPEWCQLNETGTLLSAYRMRNRLAHAYDDVRADLLFDVADVHMRELTVKAKAWLEEVERDHP